MEGQEEEEDPEVQGVLEGQILVGASSEASSFPRGPASCPEAGEGACHGGPCVWAHGVHVGACHEGHEGHEGQGGREVHEGRGVLGEEGGNQAEAA